jgi:hypothetical protein
MKKLITIYSVVMMILAVSVTAQAALMDIRCDFQNTGPVPAGNWNDIEYATYTVPTLGLIDYGTGLPTAVSTVGANWGSFDWGEAWTPSVDWVETAAAIDGFAGSDGTLPTTQTFSGLDSGKKYKVEVVSAESGLGLETLTLNGSYADTNYLNTMTGNVSQNWSLPTARANQDWMIWSSIAPDANGDLVLSITAGGNWGILNAARIVEVPEPGTLVLLSLAGLSGLAMVWIRRRRLSG